MKPEPKFSVGESVSVSGIHVKIERCYVKAREYKRDFLAFYPDGTHGIFNGWVYWVSDGKLVPIDEKALHPIPPEQKTEWAEIQKLTKWKPAGVVV